MNIENIKEKLKENKKLGIFFVLISIVYIILAIILFIKNPYNVITKYGALSIVTSLFGAFIILLIYFFIKRKNELYEHNDTSSPTVLSYITKIFGSLLAFGIVGIIIFGVVYFLKNMPTLSNTILYLLNILIIVVILTIIYSFIKPFLSRPKNPLIRLIIDGLSYVPCMVFNFINYLIIQYRITTKPVWILFSIEIVLIILYIYLPKLFDKIIKHDGLLLLSKPTSLTNETIIGSFDILNKKSEKDKFNYNYAISSWIYLNAVPSSTNNSYSENATILSYGGKPNIYYNGETSELVISAKIGHENKIIYRTNDIPYQKWFNVIINYQGGTMDIFINNKLLLSVKNIVPYMTYDSIVIGKKNGIYGFISDVNYFNKPITKDKMSWIYKTTKI
jgi:hypothetical protein